MSLLLLRMGRLLSIQLNPAQSRRWPFLIAFVFYVFTSLYLRIFPIPQETGRFILGGAVGIGLLTLLLPFSKASAHMAGMGGFTGLLVYLSRAYGIDMYAFLLPTILLTGILASARLYLGAHTNSEIVLGYLCGLLGMWAVLQWL
jgi:hypothetical protein